MSYRSLASANSQCAGAVLPTVYNDQADFAPGAVTGDVVTATAVTVGSPAVNHGLTVSNPCCYPVTAVVTYQDGGDCEPCTTDDVSTVVVEIPVPAFTEWTQSFPGVAQQVDIRIEADIPAEATEGCSIDVFGVAAAECPECLPQAVAAAPAPAPLLQTVVYDFAGTLGSDGWSGDGCGSWMVDGVNAFAVSPTVNCSETVTGLQDIADVMNLLDPNGATWAVSGTQIVAQVDSTIATQYGALTTKDATQWTGTASIRKLIRG